jgi:hypothetical protein
MNCHELLVFAKRILVVFVMSLNIVLVLSSLFLVKSSGGSGFSQTISLALIIIIFILSIFFERKIIYERKYMGIRFWRLLFVITLLNSAVAHIIRSSTF